MKLPFHSRVIARGERQQLFIRRAPGLRPKLFGLLLLFSSIGYSVFPETWNNALTLENSGDISGARALYITWLDENPGVSGYADVLIHAASLYDSPLDAIGLMEIYSTRTPHTDSFGIFARMAALESSLGLPREAAEHFELASRIGGTAGDQWLLEALALRFGMGEYPEVRTGGLRLSKMTDNAFIMDESFALASLSLALEGKADEALIEIESHIRNHSKIHSPLVWLAMRDIAAASGDSERIHQSIDALHEEFPSSVVHYLVTARILEWISPAAYILGIDSYSGNSVQTGAFRSRDGAASLRMRLENDGFTAWIEQNGDIWKVLVNDPDGDVVSRLVAGGYDSLFMGK